MVYGSNIDVNGMVTDIERQSEIVNSVFFVRYRNVENMHSVPQLAYHVSTHGLMYVEVQHKIIVRILKFVTIRKKIFNGN